MLPSLKFLQILSSQPNPENPVQSIIIERILVVELLQLPVLLDSIEDLAFDLRERNVFYAVGLKNINFETQTPNNKQDSLRLEKFFIEADSFSSKTVAHLQLPSAERVLSFTFSQSL